MSIWHDILYRRWIVLCITNDDEWPGKYPQEAATFPTMRQIPLRRRSTVIYEKRDDAEREAERLACQNPGQVFAVLGVEHVVKGEVGPWNGVPTTLPKWEPPLHQQFAQD